MEGLALEVVTGAIIIIHTTSQPLGARLHHLSIILVGNYFANSAKKMAMMNLHAADTTDLQIKLEKRLKSIKLWGRIPFI